MADERATFSRASELSAILRQRWQVESFGARTEELLRNTLFVLAATGQTLVEAPVFLTSVGFRGSLVARITNPDIADYFRDRFEPLSEPMKAVFREPLLNKITGFLTEPACRHLLGQTRSTIRFPEAIERGDWTLINLAKGRLREHAHTLGNLIFAHLQFDMLARVNIPESRRRLVTVFCDEVQNLAENDLATLLTEGRKFRVSLLTGNQFWDQLPKELRGGLLSAGTHIFFRLSSADAATLSAELSVTHRSRLHRDLTGLARGEALVRIGADVPQSILTPPLPTVRTSGPAIEALRQTALHHGSISRTEVEAEIRVRRVAPVTRLPITPDDHAQPQGQQTW